MSVTFGSSNSVSMMNDVLASLAGATINFRNQSGTVQATGSLSSSPGSVTDEGVLVLNGISMASSADLTQSVATVQIGNIFGIPARLTGALVVQNENDSTIQFLGAIIGPPIA